MDGFKQRIIGALIIVCLAVIFLPMLFDEPHQARKEQVLEVPAKPEMEPVTIEQPQEPDTPPDSGDGPEIPMANDGRIERDEGPATSQDDSEPVPQVQQEEDGALRGAWLVRLGSFSKRNNALGLRDRVREHGMDAHSQTVDTDNGTYTRVFAGPFVDKEQAQSARKQLEAEFNLKAMVIEGEED
ncbi:SPOR domain-containing protein [Halomonadaceae bacterium KBTZ08]